MHQNFKNIYKGICNSKQPIKAVIFGLSETELNKEEKVFFKKHNPFGFILFARNVKSKEQVKKLTDSLHELMGREIPILIDQEGGRVNRLIHAEDWKNKQYPSMRSFGELAITDLEKAKQELYNNYQNIADDLLEIGINTDCAPVLDLLFPETHAIIGRRAFDNNPEIVSKLGRVVCDSLIDKGIFPVIKHMPGHGRATNDSHLELPAVNQDIEILKQTDFLPFKNLNDMPFAMTAHIKYSQIDDKNPATMSPEVVKNVIRGYMDYQGIVMSDDLSMKALQGSFSEKAQKLLEAGCDIVLHCNGNMTEMKEVANSTSQINNRIKVVLEKFIQNIEREI